MEGYEDLGRDENILKDAIFVLRAPILVSM